MAKKRPGEFNTFNGLWVRGPIDTCPPDHFVDCLNTFTGKLGVGTRFSTKEYRTDADIIKMALFKPNPPYSGTNIPRIIALKTNGELHDLLLSPSLIYTNVNMTDFGFVNFFGRCYISPSNGKTGLSGEFIKVYNGTGSSGFRNAGGTKPTVALTISSSATPGNMDVGTYLFSYAFETNSGFITKPAPFVGIDTFGSACVDIDNLPLGPSHIAARWIIATKANALGSLGPLGGPYDVGKAEFLPIYFAKRIGDNTTLTVPDLTFYDEQLVEEAHYLFTIAESIPAGVGLLDYGGRMLSWGEFSDPSLVRGSYPGEPESFSETSGFFITDPTDSSGVKSAIEFRGTLFLGKHNRFYMTQDNGGLPSTWSVDNFEKTIGSDVNTIASVLDAKGSSSDGFLVGNRSGIYYFNGSFVEPELTYKVFDLWRDRINSDYFYLAQLALDPINKRIYCLLPLDGSVTVNYILVGDYREGLSPFKIKWHLWKFKNNPTDILIYSDYLSGEPNLVTRISNLSKILSLDEAKFGSDDNIPFETKFDLPPVRFSDGISHFDRIRIRAKGPCGIQPTAFSEDYKDYLVLESLDLQTDTPGREYAILNNLISEQCILRIACSNSNAGFRISWVKVEGGPIWDERPR